MRDFITYEKYLQQLDEAGKIRNIKKRSINCYKNYVSNFLEYGDKNPEEPTSQDVRAFLLAKKDEGLKATNRCFIILIYSNFDWKSCLRKKVRTCIKCNGKETE